MIINVSLDDVTLIEPDDVGHFHVRARADASDASIDALLRAAGAGVLRDGTALIELAWLRGQGDAEGSWGRGLEGMLSYADAHGWVIGEAIAAHVER